MCVDIYNPTGQPKQFMVFPVYTTIVCGWLQTLSPLEPFAPCLSSLFCFFWLCALWYYITRRWEDHRHAWQEDFFHMPISGNLNNPNYFSKGGKKQEFKTKERLVGIEFVCFRHVVKPQRSCLCRKKAPGALAILFPPAPGVCESVRRRTNRQKIWFFPLHSRLSEAFQPPARVFSLISQQC